MKNVQGSSAGVSHDASGRYHLAYTLRFPSQAGSGEFHVYKQSRRREYERIKMMEDTNKAVRRAFP